MPKFIACNTILGVIEETFFTQFHEDQSKVYAQTINKPLTNNNTVQKITCFNNTIIVYQTDELFRNIQDSWGNTVSLRHQELMETQCCKSRLTIVSSMSSSEASSSSLHSASAFCNTYSHYVYVCNQDTATEVLININRNDECPPKLVISSYFGAHATSFSQATVCE